MSPEDSDYSSDPSSSGSAHASMGEPINTTASSSSSGGGVSTSSGNYSPAAPAVNSGGGSGGGANNGVFGGLFGFNVPGSSSSSNGRVQHKVGDVDDMSAGPHGRAGSAVATAAAIMAAAVDARRPPGSSNGNGNGGMGPSS